MPSSLQGVAQEADEAKMPHKASNQGPTPIKKNKTKLSPEKKYEREQAREFAMVVKKVLAAGQGDPKYKAIAKPGGMSLRRMIPKLFNRPPEDVREAICGLKYLEEDAEDDLNLSSEDWDELYAFMPYLTFAWNQWGNQDRDPIDYSTLNRDAFMTFRTLHFKPGIWNYYDSDEATENGRKRRQREAEEEELRLKSEALKEKLRKDAENDEKIRQIERDSAESAAASLRSRRSMSSKSSLRNGIPQSITTHSKSNKRATTHHATAILGIMTVTIRTVTRLMIVVMMPTILIVHRKDMRVAVRPTLT